MESAACGLLAARSLYARLEGKELPPRLWIPCAVRWCST